jgi:peptidoglycan hydrolase CwlO-like protein
MIVNRGEVMTCLWCWLWPQMVLEKQQQQLDDLHRLDEDCCQEIARLNKDRNRVQAYADSLIKLIEQLEQDIDADEVRRRRSSFEVCVLTLMA